MKNEKALLGGGEGPTGEEGSMCANSQVESFIDDFADFGDF
jgi:hypothetical protein